MKNIRLTRKTIIIGSLTLIVIILIIVQIATSSKKGGSLPITEKAYKRKHGQESVEKTQAIDQTPLSPDEITFLNQQKLTQKYNFLNDVRTNHLKFFVFESLKSQTSMPKEITIDIDKTTCQTELASAGILETYHATSGETYSCAIHFLDPISNLVIETFSTSFNQSDLSAVSKQNGEVIYQSNQDL